MTYTFNKSRRIFQGVIASLQFKAKPCYVVKQARKMETV
jgi:hypothetical protein